MKAPEEILGGNVETFMPEKAWGETSANDDKKRFVTINAVDLANKEFPPIRWTVPDIMASVRLGGFSCPWWHSYGIG